MRIVSVVRLPPRLVVPQILLHERETGRDDRGIVEEPDERKGVRDQIERVQDVQERKPRGTERPDRHGPIPSLSGVPHERQEETAILHQSPQGPVAPKPFLNRLRPLYDRVEIRLGDATRPLFHVVRVDSLKSGSYGRVPEATHPAPKPGPYRRRRRGAFLFRGGRRRVGHGTHR